MSYSLLAPTDSKQTTTEKTIEPVKKLPVQSPSGQKRPPSPIVASQNRPPSPPGNFCRNYLGIN